MAVDDGPGNDGPAQALPGAPKRASASPQHDAADEHEDGAEHRQAEGEAGHLLFEREEQHDRHDAGEEEGKAGEGEPQDVRVEAGFNAGALGITGVVIDG